MKTRCLIGCVSILAVASMMSACGSDNDVVGNEDKGKVDAAYVWTTDAGIKACTNILFQDGKENVKGTDIGNGAQELAGGGALHRGSADARARHERGAPRQGTPHHHPGPGRQARWGSAGPRLHRPGAQPGVDRGLHLR